MKPEVGDLLIERYYVNNTEIISYVLTPYSRNETLKVLCVETMNNKTKIYTKIVSKYVINNFYQKIQKVKYVK